MTENVQEKGWEKVQIRAFTSWLNGYLSKRNLVVEDIANDLDDGVKFINFLELLGEKKVSSKWNPKPPSRIQKIENLHIGLTFLDKELHHKSSASAEDFADHNLKMILGFFWTLYKKYRIATIKHEDKSSEEGLLLWCKQKTQGYKDVEIENYKTSFRDGLAFAALCDSFLEGNKELLDYDTLAKDNGSSNLATAFEVAEKHLGVPKLLDVEDVLEGTVDERSMVLYISLFFHAFNAKEQQRGATEERERLASEMKGLQGSLEERAKLAAELQSENQSLKERLDSLEKRFEEEKRAREAAEAELARVKAELEEERNKNKGLEAGKLELQGQMVSLEGQVSELTSRFNVAEKNRKALEENSESLSATQTKGLGVLKKNLEEHLEDLHRWQAFLDFDKVSDLDFSGEVRPAILAEIKESNFDEQLQKISDRLEKENADLLAHLKAKENEKQLVQKKEQEKKERQAKEKK